MKKEGYLMNGKHCNDLFEMQLLDDLVRLPKIETSDSFNPKVISFEEFVNEIRFDYSNAQTLHYNNVNDNGSVEIGLYDNVCQSSHIDNAFQFSNGEKSYQFADGYCPKQVADGYKSNQIAIGDGVAQTSFESCNQISIGKCIGQSSFGPKSKQHAKGECSYQAAFGYDSNQFNQGDNSIQVSFDDGCSHETIGNGNVIFAGGVDSMAKGSVGTWITLCERDYLISGCPIVHVATAQIGNPNYLDYNGFLLLENRFYVLNGKKFTPILKSNSTIYQILETMKQEDFVVFRVKKLHTSEDDGVYFAIETKEEPIIKDSFEQVMAEAICGGHNF